MAMGGIATAIGHRARTIRPVSLIAGEHQPRTRDDDGRAKGHDCHSFHLKASVCI